MKKLLLALPLFLAMNAEAQYLGLNGTSYTQNFDNIGGGLPAGWSVDTSATATDPGDDVPFDAAKYKWSDTRGAFKNFASANSLTEGTDSATQAQATDRALGLRQVSNMASSLKNTDPGGAFILRIANTTGLSGFQLSFKLQSLDTSSPRTTTWIVDYATGTNPTSFTPASATGTLTTGNKIFSNNTITVNFGTALDNKSEPVWIRIATLTATTGSGNRASTAIDDFSLTWTGTANSIAGSGSNATFPLWASYQSSAQQLVIGYELRNPGPCEVHVYNLIGKEVYRGSLHAKEGQQRTALPGISLGSGMYIIKLGNGPQTATTRVTVP